jgi:hypothetical protein
MILSIFDQLFTLPILHLYHPLQQFGIYDELQNIGDKRTGERSLVAAVVVAASILLVSIS